MSKFNSLQSLQILLERPTKPASLELGSFEAKASVSRDNKSWIFITFFFGGANLECFAENETIKSFYNRKFAPPPSLNLQFRI